MIPNLRKIRKGYRLIKLTRTWWFLWYVINAGLTRASFWQRFIVRRVQGKNLVRAISGLNDYHCKELVSLVLPVNNGRTKCVERLVASLKAQTHKNIEFIAVDSGSTDDTVLWLRNEGFNVIEIEPMSFTHALSRNTGAALAKGKYLLFTVDDAVFRNPDWIRSAIYLLEYFGVDSMSSRQTIDDNADLYARCLDSFLSKAQATSLTINISRTSFFSRWLHRHLPLHAQYRSVAIDDTNHLVRREVFERIRFRSSTVEDIDFALRLVSSGGITLYTNMLTVLHYHTYNMDTFTKYARRVYIDSLVISQWERYMIRFRSRESFLVSGLHILAIFMQAFTVSYGANKHHKLISSDHKKEILKLINKINDLYKSKSGAINLRNNSSFDEAIELFISIFGGLPPSDLYYCGPTTDYVIHKLLDDFYNALSNISCESVDCFSYNEIKNVFLFLWVNRMMSHMARPEIFENISINYPCDDWNISVWT